MSAPLIETAKDNETSIRLMSDIFWALLPLSSLYIGVISQKDSGILSFWLYYFMGMIPAFLVILFFLKIGMNKYSQQIKKETQGLYDAKALKMIIDSHLTDYVNQHISVSLWLAVTWPILILMLSMKLCYSLYQKSSGIAIILKKKISTLVVRLMI